MGIKYEREGAGQDKLPRQRLLAYLGGFYFSIYLVPRAAPYSGTGSVRGYFSQMAAEAELKDRIAVWGTIKCWKLAVWPTFCAIIGKSVIRRA